MVQYISFSQGLEELKKGNVIQRKWWKGKNNYIYLGKGKVSSNFKFKDISGVSRRHFDIFDGDIVTTHPNIVFRDTNGCFNNGWQPNCNDMLSNDWCIVNFDKSNG